MKKETNAIPSFKANTSCTNWTSFCVIFVPFPQIFYVQISHQTPLGHKWLILVRLFTFSLASRAHGDFFLQNCGLLFQNWAEFNWGGDLCLIIFVCFCYFSKLQSLGLCYTPNKLCDVLVWLSFGLMLTNEFKFKQFFEQFVCPPSGL